MTRVRDPRRVFLDEPTTGLEQQARANLWTHSAAGRRHDRFPHHARGRRGPAVFRGDVWTPETLWGTLGALGLAAAGLGVGTRTFRRQNA